jgi:Ice-binding-like/Prealbumin-like fold domain
MEKISKNLLITAVIAASFALGIAGPISALAATAPSLGTAGAFGILSDTFTNSNTPPQTTITGNVCYTTGPTTVPLAISGTTSTPCDPATGLDQGLALADLNSQPCTSLGTTVDLDSVIVGANPPGTFPPGCYTSSGAMNITLSSTVTLDGPGVYIFRPGGALTTGQDSRVVLMNGADASDVFWAPIGLASLGANSAPSLTTPTFVGNIFGAAGITMGHFANLAGRALAFGKTVTTDANTITVSAVSNLTTLRVIKLVVNGNGGTATPSSFMLHVKNSGGVDVAGSPANGTSTPGTLYSLTAGTYAVSEDANASYVQSFTGDCDSSGSVTLLSGTNRICTIVNTDIPPPAPVAVAAVFGNPGGGSIIVPVIGILKVPTPLALPGGPGPVTYNYTVWNVGGQRALANVTVTDDKCSPITFLSGDINGNNKLDTNESWRYSCTTTLGQTTTNTAIATGHSDDSSGQTAIATAIATVAVGGPFAAALFPNTGLLPPPLINIVKVPSRLTPFPFGGGAVTYTYAVTNPGVVAMHDVLVTDDMCGPVSRTSEDPNGNNLLDPGETWIYTCQTNVAVSTRNVATAQGSANGSIALGYAFATVLVAAPGLPNTGLPPVGVGAWWGAVLLVGILVLVSVSRAWVLQKSKETRS